MSGNLSGHVGFKEAIKILPRTGDGIGLENLVEWRQGVEKVRDQDLRSKGRTLKLQGNGKVK